MLSEHKDKGRKTTKLMTYFYNFIGSKHLTAPVPSQITTKTVTTLKPEKPEVKIKTTAMITEITTFQPMKPRHKLGLIVPYRDRLEELLEFVPYMAQFLNEQKITFHIYVINQVDMHRLVIIAYVQVIFRWFHSNITLNPITLCLIIHVVTFLIL